MKNKTQKSNDYTMPKMVGWFNVKQLARTGIQSAISDIFGNYADKRESQKVQDKPFYDLSKIDDKDGDFWFDYIADLGDGFNSTYTIAHLLANGNQVDNALTSSNDIIVENIDAKADNDYILKKGKLLILGSDIVYPTPEIENYDNRFKIPYRAACKKDEPANKTEIEEADKVENETLMFAIPGNHDWYDGLTNFTKIFMQKRFIGDWRTRQSRSYFAIKLPHDYWIWGIDVQLHSNIDEPQLAFFENLPKEKGANMSADSKIILCTAEPAWVYNQLFKQDATYDRLRFFEENYITKKEFKHLATLTGDLHHYAHYKATNDKAAPKHRIIAGGGGAFLHPTHILPDALYPNTLKGTSESLKLEATFPSKKESRKLYWRNFLIFPFRNRSFFLLMGAFSLIFAWLAKSNYLNPNNPTQDLVNSIIVNPHQSFGTTVGVMFPLWIYQPSVALFTLIIWFGFYVFLNPKESRKQITDGAIIGFFKNNPKIISIFHGLIQTGSFFTVFWISCRLVTQEYLKMDKFILFSLHLPYYGILLVILIFVLGSVFGSFIMAIYLFLSNMIFNMHIDESFSGFAFEDYKNMLRIKITKDQLTIYPLGVEKVPTDWKNDGFNTNTKVHQFSSETLKKDKYIKVILIEDPIIIP